MSTLACTIPPGWNRNLVRNNIAQQIAWNRTLIKHNFENILILTFRYLTRNRVTITLVWNVRLRLLRGVVLSSLCLQVCEIYETLFRSVNANLPTQLSSNVAKPSIRFLIWTIIMVIYYSCSVARGNISLQFSICNWQRNGNVTNFPCTKLSK